MAVAGPAYNSYMPSRINVSSGLDSTRADASRPWTPRQKKSPRMTEGLHHAGAGRLLLGSVGNGTARIGHVLAHSCNGVAALQDESKHHESRQHNLAAHMKSPPLRYVQAMRTRSSPRPSTPPTMTSPLTTAPTPSGVPVKMMSPGCSSNRPDR
ncbi:Uncharacterised protein [Bordetella pertussis]|nr:Uncharacterised protein [Bordetella pertussis]CFW48365.1 Uncharacterised protein [Bordetella pertussis]